MSKTIDTLVKDIQEVINGKGGWDKTVNEYFKEVIGEAAERRLSSSSEERPKTLRMSNIGTPCKRKLWYYLNLKDFNVEHSASTKLKFFYGDIIEGLLLSLAKAAGHTVVGEQDELNAYGIKGHRDAVIDGVTVDVKSASSLSFDKFRNNNLRVDDPFGYLLQLAGYVSAAKDDPLVIDKRQGAFLVMDKQHGHLCLDVYDFSPELLLMEQRIKEVKEATTQDEEPERGFEDTPEGKSGNKKLVAGCSYCDYKKVCWPGLRTFIYSRGPVYLTEVVRTPDVYEVKDEL